jgi:hypothetical protein
MKNKASLIPFLILALVTILGCGRFTQQANNSSEPRTDSDVESNEFTLAGKEWKSVDLNEMDIKVDLPGQPSDKTPPPSQLPPGYKEIFSSMRIHSYDEKDFASSYSQLVPTGKRKFDINELAETSMTALKRQARDLKYNVDVKSPTNAKLDGTFTRNGKTMELKGCVIQQKKPERVWAVITLFPTDNADARSASQKIIDSAKFKESAEECEG